MNAETLDTFTATNFDSLFDTLRKRFWYRTGEGLSASEVGVLYLSLVFLQHPDLLHIQLLIEAADGAGIAARYDSIEGFKRRTEVYRVTLRGRSYEITMALDDTVKPATVRGTIEWGLPRIIPAL